MQQDLRNTTLSNTTLSNTTLPKQHCKSYTLNNIATLNAILSATARTWATVHVERTAKMLCRHVVRADQREVVQRAEGSE